MLDDRKKAAEAKFAHDGDQTFTISARRNRLAGEWAGEKLGKTGDDLKAYAASIASLVAMFDQTAALEATVNRLVLDLDGSVTEAEVKDKLALLQVQAERQILEG